MLHIREFCHCQIKRLIIETRSYELLAGGVTADGTREGGALDAHFSPSQVSIMLNEAAEDALRERGSVGDAAELLALAGNFSNLLSLLNSELASLLVVHGSADQQKRQ